jgi:hypothetical protein
MGVGCAKKFLAGIFNGATNLPVGIRMSNIEQGISNVEVWNRFALSFNI